MGLVTKSVLAEEDLIGIWLHVAIDNVVAADKLLDAFDKCFLNLSDMPGMGSIIDGLQSEWAEEMRYFSVKDYLIFYSIEGKSEIEIIRVIHAALDYTRIL